MSNSLITTEDGSHSLISDKFGVGYHSKHGAIQETQHVFINAALRFKAAIQKELSILDMGFGTGLNAYMTFLEATMRKFNVHYTAIEAYPISSEEAATLNYSTVLNIEEFKEDFLKMHRHEWSQEISLSDYFHFIKHKMRFEALEYEDQFDIIYFDAFAPAAQPELWEEDMLKSMYKALKKNGVFVTYCAKGTVKRGMKAVGFQVETLPGPPGKREMTRGLKINITPI